eukprot:TRINITY_DN9594_c0_g2_i2.p1 TRINITY_DN9594_c0_g2~~TRINITY_DN9594_c0_g2_i2.p1  ORF type:complete len:773 (+),score=115.43 TRINITY_DN9594_c0_g2_i2:88-2406(+)
MWRRARKAGGARRQRRAAGAGASPRRGPLLSPRPRAGSPRRGGLAQRVRAAAAALRWPWQRRGGPPDNRSASSAHTSLTDILNASPIHAGPRDRDCMWSPKRTACPRALSPVPRSGTPAHQRCCGSPRTPAAPQTPAAPRTPAALRSPAAPRSVGLSLAFPVHTPTRRSPAAQQQRRAAAPCCSPGPQPHPAAQRRTARFGSPAAQRRSRPAAPGSPRGRRPRSNPPRFGPPPPLEAPRRWRRPPPVDLHDLPSNATELAERRAAGYTGNVIGIRTGGGGVLQVRVYEAEPRSATWESAWTGELWATPPVCQEYPIQVLPWSPPRREYKACGHRRVGDCNCVLVGGRFRKAGRSAAERQAAFRRRREELLRRRADAEQPPPPDGDGARSELPPPLSGGSARSSPPPVTTDDGWGWDRCPPAALQPREASPHSGDSWGGGGGPPAGTAAERDPPATRPPPQPHRIPTPQLQSGPTAVGPAPGAPDAWEGGGTAIPFGDLSDGAWAGGGSRAPCTTEPGSGGGSPPPDFGSAPCSRGSSVAADEMGWDPRPAAGFQPREASPRSEGSWFGGGGPPATAAERDQPSARPDLEGSPTPPLQSCPAALGSAPGPSDAWGGACEGGGTALLCRESAPMLADAGDGAQAGGGGPLSAQRVRKPADEAGDCDWAGRGWLSVQRAQESAAEPAQEPADGAWGWHDAACPPPPEGSGEWASPSPAAHGGSSPWAGQLRGLAALLSPSPDGPRSPGSRWTPGPGGGTSTGMPMPRTEASDEGW